MNSPSEADDGLIGNPNAAQDLYGVGVRIGLYLQATGIILTMIRPKRSGIGVHLAVGAISLSILSCWTVMTARQEFSSCEAYLELALLNISTGPGLMVTFSTESAVGEAVGQFCFLFARIWSNISALWFFIQPYRVLPLLGTKNVTFFFAKVDIEGWFRVAMLIFYVFETVFGLLWAMDGIVALWASAAFYWRGKSKADDNTKTINIGKDISLQLNIPTASRIHPTDSVFPMCKFVFAVTTVETTIAWNNLSPSTDLSSPGQLIPFITGIVIFIDGLLSVLRPRKPELRDKDVSTNSSEESTAHDVVKLRRTSRAWSV